MTRNEIEYQNYLEAVRTNKQKEFLQQQANEEARRANLAREAETRRYNDIQANYNARSLTLNDIISQRAAETQISTANTQAQSAKTVASINASAQKAVASLTNKTNAQIATNRDTNSYNIATLNNSTSTANAIMSDRTERYKADKAYSGTALGVGGTIVKEIVSGLIGGFKGR